MALSTTITEVKERALFRLRSEIEGLALQSTWSEKGGWQMRAQGSLATILDAGLITVDEYVTLGNEIGEANEKAAKQAQEFDPQP